MAFVDPGLAVHAHHAELQGVRGGDAAEAEQRGGDGDVLAFGEGEDLGDRAGLDDAVAGEDDGLLRLLDEGYGLLDGGGVGRQPGAEHRVGAVGAGLRHVEVEDGGGLLGVLGDVDEDGAGAAGAGDLKGFADGGGDVFGARDEEVVLGDGQGDAGDVDLLKRIGAEDLGGDLAGDGDHRDAVEHGRRKAGDEVRRSRAGGGHADADAA